jgi:ATP-dependent DNA ligase
MFIANGNKNRTDVVARPRLPSRRRFRRRRVSQLKPKLPSGSEWLHEIKHDGFRIIARKNGAQVRLYSRPGNHLTHRFPLIVETLARLRSRSCIFDGEAVACECASSAL